MSKLDELIQKLYPNGVEYKKLIECLSRPITDGPHETPHLINEGIPFISVESIHDGIVDLSRCRGYISKEYDQICSKKYKPQKGDVFLVKSASVGKVAMVTNDEDFNIWSPLAAMRCNSKVMIPRFLFYVLQTDRIQQLVLNKSSKGSQSNLSMRVLEQFDIPVPPMEVQCEIVQILDQFTLLIAELTAELTARRQQYEFYREKLLTEDSLVKRKEYKLNELSTIKGRIGFRGYTVDDLVKKGEGAISLSPGNIQNGHIIFDNNTYLSWGKYFESPEIMLEVGDVVICKTGSTVGKVAYVEELPVETTLNPQLVVLKKIECNSKYLYYYLLNNQAQYYIKSNAGIGSVPNISQEKLGNLIIELPSLEEQQRIVDILDKFDAYCNDLTQGLPAEIELRKQQYEYYRDKLLSFKELK